MKCQGPPQVLHEVSSRYMSVERGEDAVISAIFCADPRPTKVSWRWASYRMEAGDGNGRFIAEALQKVTPTLPPPLVVNDVIAIADDDADIDDNIDEATNEGTEFYDAASELRAHRYEAASVTVPAQTPPHAIFTYPVGKMASSFFHFLPPFTATFLLRILLLMPQVPFLAY